jgi:phage portal protein BeeE
VPGLLISPTGDQEIDPDSAEYLKREVLNRTSGDDRGKPFIAGGPVKVSQFGFDPKSMDVRALRRVPEERIAAALGIPAVVLGYGAGLDRSIYNNVAEAREAAYESYLLPLQRIIAETLASHLLTEFDQRPAAFIEFDNSAVRVLAEDSDNLAKRLVALYEGGLIKRGEARTQLGLEATPADEVYFTELASAGQLSGVQTINVEQPAGKSITANVVEAINDAHRRGFVA